MNKLSDIPERGSRLKQNHVKLGQTKNSQYHITLPKGIVEALGLAKGSIFKVVIEKGNIVLRKKDEK